MNLTYGPRNISFKKELNDLDRFAIDFSEKLKALNIDHVFISGYVAILFGRSRSSEDIDVFIQHCSEEDFLRLWNTLSEQYECMNTNDPHEAYNNYLCSDVAIRFVHHGKVMPNMEVKFPKKELDVWAIKNRIKVQLNKDVLYISPLELQIPYKLYLGGEKDIEDGVFLYKVFKKYLDMPLFTKFKKELTIDNSLMEYLQ